MLICDMFITHCTWEEEEPAAVAAAAADDDAADAAGGAATTAGTGAASTASNCWCWRAGQQLGKRCVSLVKR